MKKISLLLSPALLGIALAGGPAHATSFKFRVVSPGLLGPVANTPALPAAEGVLTADTSADFGALASGGSASRIFTFRNTKSTSINGLSAAIAQTTGLTLAANSCGTAAAPVSLPANGQCAMTLTYGGTTASSLAGSWVRVSGPFVGSPSTVALSGSIAGFDAAAAWSSAGGSLTALTASDLDYGTKTTNSLTRRTYYLRSTGTSGVQASGFTISGNTADFKFTNWGITSSGTLTSPPVFYSCSSGGALATDKLSVSPCRSHPAYAAVTVQFEYSPTTIGTHSITVTPTTDNGTALPGAITLTGTGQFNPEAAWSSSGSSLAALTSANMNFGTRTTGTSTYQTYYMRNVGTNGALAVGYVMSGDASQFKFSNWGKTATGTLAAAGTFASCTAPAAARSADGTSLTPCISDDVVATGAYIALGVTMQYAPTTVGNHAVTLTPVTSNGTVLPGPITLTGTGQFNPQAAWSSSGSSLVALTPANMSFGTRTTGSSTYQTYYMRNVGTNGALAVGYVMSGDTSQFKFYNWGKTASGTLATAPVYVTCVAPAPTLSADKTSLTPCITDDVAAGGYPAIATTLQYAPTTVGNHAVTLTPVTSNGTVLPGAITLTGTGQ